MEEIPALVVDNGSSVIKAGFAGDDAPLSQFPSVIGRTQMPLSTNDGCYFGNDALANNGRVHLNYPIERGIVNNWDDMEMIWRHTFNTALGVNPSEHPVLLTEPALNPKPNREKMSQIMFEKFNVPSMYAANQAVLSLYSTGPITGVVIESGAGVTYVVPIVDGHAITHAIMRLDIGGADLTDYLTRLLSEGGHTFDTAPTARTVVNDIKERCCSVADDFEAGLQTIAATPHFENAYEMPDGNRINIGDAGIRCPEAMFQPSLLGLESAGIHELVHSAIMKCDKDLQQYLYRNVILSGGKKNAFFPGMKERLQGIEGSCY